MPASRSGPAEPSRQTLIYVLETYWEGTLDRPDYALGEILLALCGRYGRTAEVRQRKLHSVTDFLRLAPLAAFWPGPVIMVISSHGGPCGPRFERSAVEGEHAPLAPIAMGGFLVKLIRI